MKRREVFQKLTAFGAMTAFAPLLKAATDKDLKEVKIIKPAKDHKIAIDLEAISHIHNGVKILTAKEIMELYFETGVLLYQKTPTMGSNYQPVRIIPK